MTAYSFKRRFVAPVHVGLGLALDTLPQGFGRPVGVVVPKTHTIRANGLRRHARPGEALQLYHAQRTKQCFKIGDTSCRQVREIQIDIGNAGDMAFRIAGRLLRSPAAERFAISDGFDSIEDMWSFWQQNHPKVSRFNGAIIDWSAT